MNFRHDSINYPSGFGYALQHIWKQLENENIPKDQAQAMLQDLADWVSTCEKGEPKWKGWNV